MPDRPPQPDEARAEDGLIPVGVSACLLGRQVRHDGGHRRDRFVVETMGAYFDYVPVCPEVEAGMGVPRPSLRLIADGERPPRLVAPSSGVDWTGPMHDWAAERIAGLTRRGLRGFVLKSRSPSCGMSRVRVYGAGGHRIGDGSGLFATALAAALPLLPIEEDGRLNDPRLRENFVLRVFVHDEWLRLREAPTAGGLVRFHTRHKILLLAHDPGRSTALGRLVAEAGKAALDPVLDRYGPIMMQALARPGSPRRQVNAMQHLAGVVKTRLEGADKRELEGLIGEYRAGRVPMEVPLTLLRHHLRRSGHTWALAQSYLDPYPRPLGLRSHL